MPYGHTDRLKVFISYARKDLQFAERIVSALEARGLMPTIDTRDLPTLEDWRRELLSFIHDSDAVVFIISRNSISSRVCAWEVEQVARLNKRLAPIVLQRVDNDGIPGGIAQINYLFFDPPNDFDTQADKLAAALQTNSNWVKEHTRLGEHARRWQLAMQQGAAATADALLLRGAPLSDAELWISRTPRMAPEPTEAHRLFISASRRAEQARSASEKEQLARTHKLQKRSAWALAGIGALVLSALVISLRQAQENERRQAIILAAAADQAIVDHRYELAMRLSLYGLPPQGRPPWSLNWSSPEVTTLLARLTTAARRSAVRATIYTKDLLSAAFSPDGKQIVSVTKDAISSWDASSGELIRTLQVSDGGVLKAAFSQTRSRLVTLTRNGRFIIWDLANWQVLTVVNAYFPADAQSRRGSPNMIAISPSSSQIVSVGGGAFIGSGEAKTQLPNVHVWDAGTGRLLREFTLPEAWISSIRFSNDQRVMLTVRNSDDQRPATEAVYILDPKTGQKTMTKGRGSHIYAADLSEDGTRFAIAAVSFNEAISYKRSQVTVVSNLSIQDVATQEVLRNFNITGEKVTSVALNPAGKRIAAGTESTRKFKMLFSEEEGEFGFIRIWDSASGQLVAVLRGGEGDITELSYSPDGKHLLSAYDTGEIRVWDVERVDLLFSLKGRDDRDPVKARFSSDGTRIVAAGGSVRVWRSEDGVQLFSLTEPGPIYEAEMSGDLLLTSFAMDEQFVAVRVRSISHGKILFEVKNKTLHGMYGSISKRGDRVVITSDKVRIWELGTRKVLREIGEPKVFYPTKFGGDDEFIVSGGGVSPDGAYVVTAESPAVVWSAKTGALILKVDAPTKEGVLARVWDLKTGQKVIEIEGQGLATEAFYSANGARIVTSDHAGNVRIWNSQNGVLLLGINTSSTMAYADLHPSGRRIVIGSEGGDVTVWDTIWPGTFWSEELAMRICDRMLPGKTALFTSDDERRTILKGIVGHNPCNRFGMFSLQHWVNYLGKVSKNN